MLGDRSIRHADPRESVFGPLTTWQAAAEGRLRPRARISRLASSVGVDGNRCALSGRQSFAAAETARSEHEFSEDRSEDEDGGTMSRAIDWYAGATGEGGAPTPVECGA